MRTHRQKAGDSVSAASLNLIPCGSVLQYARRTAAEAQNDVTAAETLIAAAEDATVEAGGKPLAPGELAASGLKLAQFLLLRVAPFVDVWEGVARAQLAKGDQTAALIAAERASTSNPGWGCCMFLQAQLMASLGRREEQRDLALAALEAPYWTLSVPLQEALNAAQVGHLENLRQLVRQMEDQVRDQQGAKPRSAEEVALLRAQDALDDVVRTEGLWDTARPLVASALRQAGIEEAARVAELADDVVLDWEHA